MNVLLLAGGNGTRMHGAAKKNKHLIDIGDKKLIDYPLEKIQQLDYNKLTIVLGNEARKTSEYIHNKINKKKNVTYVLQPVPDGIAKACQLSLMTRETSFKGESFVLHLGDQIYEDRLDEFVAGFEDSHYDVKIWLKHCVEDAKNHTVVQLYQGKVVDMIEKPNVREGYVPVGVWLFKPNVFRYLEDMKPGVNGEYWISDVVRRMMDAGCSVGYEIMGGWWVDVGTPEKVKEAERYLGNSD